MRRRKLKWLWKRLKELQRQRPTYKRLLLQLGAAKNEAGRAFALVHLFLPEAPPKEKRSQRVDFGFTLSRTRLRIARRREGRYLLRTNLTSTEPAQLWQFYLQLAEVEAAFRDIKGDLTVRQALEKFAAMQLLDVHFPTTDGRELIFTRYTEPESDQQMLLAKLDWTLPPQLPPRIAAAKIAASM